MIKTLRFIYSGLLVMAALHAVSAPITGVFSVPGDYPTVAAAVNDINVNGIGSGGCIFNIAAGYSEITTGISLNTQTTIDANHFITFQKSGSGPNPLLVGLGGSGSDDAVFWISGTCYVTVDGLDATAADELMEYGYLVSNAGPTMGSQFNIIKNCRITLNNLNPYTIGIRQMSIYTPSVPEGKNSYNEYRSNIIDHCFSGIILDALNSAPDTDCIIASNFIGTAGYGSIGGNAIPQGSGGLAIWGIRANYVSNLKVFSNEVCNVVRTTSRDIGGVFMMGCNGISEIYNNKVHDVYYLGSATNYRCYGLRIEEFPDNSAYVYNNMVWNIYNGITNLVSGLGAYGILVNSQAQYTGRVNAFHNTVSVAPGTSPGSAAFAALYGTVHLQNNIFINKSGGGPTSKRYCIYANAGTLFASDNNVFYIPSGQNNFLGFYAGTNRQNLSAWQLAAGKDFNSLFMDVSFVSSYDLHIKASANCGMDGHGSPVAGFPVPNDIDGDVRDVAAPDIGADEFTSVLPLITGVTPSFVCEIGPVTLQAAASSGLIHWWDAPSGGMLLGTGNIFTTPVLSVTTHYYVNTVNGTCTSSGTETITASVHAIVPVEVEISSANNVCPGTPVTFTAAPQNQGNAPVYQWLVNGVVQQSGNSPSFIYTPIDLDEVTCILTSSGACVMNNPATSNTIIIYVGFTLPPYLACPGNINVPNDPEVCGAVVNYLTPKGSGCGFTYTYQTGGLPPGYFFPVGTTMNSFIALNQSGHITTCSFTITVNDVDMPDISCPGYIIVPTDPGLCGAVVDYDIPYGDNCNHVFQQTTGQASGTFFATGTTLNTFVVEDASGHSSVCESFVIVRDEDPPTLVCPGNATVDVGSSACTYFINGQDFVPSVTENCSSISLYNSLNFLNTLGGTVLNPGSQSITWYASDDDGNNSSCSFNLTVVDNAPPLVQCPDDIIVLNDPGLCGAWVDYTIPASDNCGAINSTQTSGLPSGAFFPVGVTQITFKFTDPYNNVTICSFSVTVMDAEPPQALCPLDEYRNVDPGYCSYTVIQSEFDPMVSDNCLNVTLWNDFNNAASLAGAVLPTGITIVNWTITDASGNPVICTHNINVYDNQLPQLQCPSDVAISTTPAHCGFNVADHSFDAIMTDNCPGISALNDYNGTTTLFGALIIPGANMITWSVNDGTNAVSCSFTLTVTDSEAPQISCPGDITLCYENAGIQLMDTQPYYAWDNCGVGSLTTDQPAIFPVGQTLVTWTAADANSNTATCATLVSLSNSIEITITQSSLPELCQGQGVLLSAIVAGSAQVQYIWSNGVTEAESFFDISYNQSFVSVNATNEMGCTATATFFIDIDPFVMLSSYVILTRDHIKLDGTVVHSGGLGVKPGKKSKIEAKKQSDVTAPGTFARAQQIDVDAGSSITMQIPSPAPVAWPLFESMPYHGSLNINIPAGTVMYLNDTLYREIKVGKNAVAIFTKPVVNVEKKLKMEDGAVLRFADCSKVRIRDKMEAGKNVSINPDETFVVFYVDDDVKFKEGAHVVAVMYLGKENSPDTVKHHLHVEASKASRPAVFKGMFLAECIHSGKNTHWYLGDNCNFCNPVLPKDLAVTYGSGESAELVVENFPNPFNTKTMLNVKVPAPTYATLDIFDASGKLVTRVFEGNMEAGQSYSFEFDATALPDGLYHYRFTTPDSSLGGKMIHLNY